MSGLIAGISAGIGLASALVDAHDARKQADEARKWQRGGINTLKNLDRLKLPSIDSIDDKYTAQGKQLPELYNFSTDVNQAYRDQLSQTAPELAQSAEQLSASTNSLLRGEIPQDVADQIRRQTAERGVLGGYGSGSGMGRNLTARDLGLTSLDMMRQGAQTLPEVAQLAAALNPVSVQDSIFSPGAIMSREDSVAQYNNQIGNTWRYARANAAFIPRGPSDWSAGLGFLSSQLNGGGGGGGGQPSGVGAISAPGGGGVGGTATMKLLSSIFGA
jgi:hypothetical protein